MSRQLHTSHAAMTASHAGALPFPTFAGAPLCGVGHGSGAHLQLHGRVAAEPRPILHPCADRRHLQGPQRPPRALPPGAACSHHHSIAHSCLLHDAPLPSRLPSALRSGERKGETKVATRMQVLSHHSPNPPMNPAVVPRPLQVGNFSWGQRIGNLAFRCLQFGTAGIFASAAGHSLVVLSVGAACLSPSLSGSGAALGPLRPQRKDAA